MNKEIQLLLFLFLSFSLSAFAQPDRWQQRAEYTMDVDFDVTTNRFDGQQKLVYFNNSPDELSRVFYHLYLNAFQPGSMMDVRTNELPDGDSRIKGRIGSLSPTEIGYQKIKSLKMNGEDCEFEVVGTVLEVYLPKQIEPNSSVTFEMDFQGQVPLQIRRNGRDNAEGISYSMAQWYPKMCEYDYQGWHANPYVAREFYGVWGDFDVTIHIDQRYMVAATGYLQNPTEIGFGYLKGDQKLAQKVKSGKLAWHFKAPNVHDFVWAADPDYTHTILQAQDGPEMHFFYQKNEKTEEVWQRLPAIMDKAFAYMNKNFGKYPYDKYSFIQGGDGGMEYPMATLITGERPLESLVGVAVHELLHSWYQMVLGTNESLYPWMDEGFTSYASDETMNYLEGEGLIPGKTGVENPHLGTYNGFANFTKSGLEEPLSMHSDHYSSNAAYGVGSYVKGAIFLQQLKYIIGEPAFKSGMLRYFDTWKFKHPNANDFIRVMEKESGLELDWYKEYWVNTTRTIDYAVTKVGKGDSKKETVISLARMGKMPMPIDLVVTMENGDKMYYNIPLQIMRGEKPQEFTDGSWEVVEDWPWTNPHYQLEIDAKYKKVAKVEIDPSHRMMDVDRSNNFYELIKKK